MDGEVLDPASAVTAYLGLGSNLGDRRAAMRRAVGLLRAQPGLMVTRTSSLYETDPIGGPPGQAPYLNAVVAVATTLSPQALLSGCLSIENQLGRQRTVRRGPRTLDLDLLLYGNRVEQGPNLFLPHPLMHERRFVLVPLAEIAPEACHPVAGQCIMALLDALPLSNATSQAGERVDPVAGPTWWQM
jgi:2-amino-4-hydroxy-6-hydroxymethyldihydropteridine diphosphokinase